MDTNMKFVRSFRWTLEGEFLKPYLMLSAKIDFIHKTVSLRKLVLDADEKEFEVWLESIQSCGKPDDHILLENYDEAGNVIARYRFQGMLAVVADTEEYDYANSEPLVREIALQYGSVTKERNFTNAKDHPCDS